MHIRITYKNVIIYSCPFLVLDMVLHLAFFISHYYFGVETRQEHETLILFSSHIAFH